MAGTPTFEVVTPASTDDRLLISVAAIRALSNIPSTGDGAVSDDNVKQMISSTLAQAATVCDLARARGVSPTLAREVVRATWRSTYGRWGAATNYLLLPHRTPITSITVTESGSALVENVDYELDSNGALTRVGSCWSTSGNIVVDYTAGWLAMDGLPADQESTDGMMPPDLVSLFAEQIRMTSDGMALDKNLRSEDIPGVWSGTFAVAGGSSVDTCGLMMPLYEALSAYRAPPSV
jgi:hypothetical protein